MLPAFSRLSTNACLKPRSHRIKAAAASYRSPSYSHSTFGVKSRGGKILLWHGGADGAIMATSSIGCYEGVVKFMGGR